MKDIVARILKEESEASKIVQEAKEQAERIILDARKERDEVINKIMSESSSFVDTQRRETEKKFFSEKDSILKEAKKATLSAIEKKNKDIPDMSKKVFSQIISIKE